TVHVEDEFLAVQYRAGEIVVERGVARHLVERAGASCRGVDLVEGQQRAGGAGRRDQEVAAGDAQSAGVVGGRCHRAVVGGGGARTDRDRGVLPVRGRVHLDRQASAVGVVTRHWSSEGGAARS